ncbi:MAG: malate dehydrogenase (quinone) [Polyangiales bacterium]
MANVEVPGDGVLDCDAVFVGAGVMSATAATLLTELDPSLRVEVFERLDRVAGESSDARNNAGTGHSALCELNYTPDRDGKVDVAKAVKVMECFEVSKQLWAWLASQKRLDPGFISSVPHASFVTGDADVDFLRRRHAALTARPLFASMRFSDDPAELARWMPLVMEGRPAGGPVAATWSHLGTDVDFGALTRGLFRDLERARGAAPWLSHEVRAIEREEGGGRWVLTVDDETLHVTRKVRAPFVFLGAGGGALPLLTASGIPEASGYAGFPVGGQWLVCRDPATVARHGAKVYGKPSVGTPPMSVPHLDTRFIDGERALIFGPFAGFSTKFLKEGSYLDLPRSVTADNLVPLVGAGAANLALTRYLIEQVTQSFEERVEALRAFLPTARAEDWQLTEAGQRVQVIRRDDEDGGRLEFGTEIVSAADNSLAALLGASPGASTSVSVALDLLADCFPALMASDAAKAKLAAMVPSWGRGLDGDPGLLADVRARSHAALGLVAP